MNEKYVNIININPLNPYDKETIRSFTMPKFSKCLFANHIPTLEMSIIFITKRMLKPCNIADLPKKRRMKLKGLKMK